MMITLPPGACFAADSTNKQRSSSIWRAKSNALAFSNFHRMTPMTFILQFCDSLVEGVQFVLQFLNFVLNGKSSRRISINGLVLLCTR